MRIWNGSFTSLLSLIQPYLRSTLIGLWSHNPKLQISNTNQVTITFMNSIGVGTFTRSILIEIAHNRGYLADSGIRVDEISVPSSPAAFEMLESSAIDVLITSPDNVLAYRYLSKNPLARKLDVRIIGAIDRGLGLSLCYAPNLVLTPSTLGVDVPTSGFAFVGFELLAQQGIARESYSIDLLGSTPKRRVDLVAGKVDSTILNAGNEIKAISQGARKIADISTIGPYIGTVLSVIGEPSPVELMLREVLDLVVREVLGGQHAALIIEIAQKNLQLAEELALEHYYTLIDPTHGLVRGGQMDLPSLRTLIDLRNKYLPTNELDDVLADIGTLVRTN
jgi:hypothetical protein